ncbi:hypothetical protein GYB59_12855 [bacterium]|nr:hypothetical protein [bacterium]
MGIKLAEGRKLTIVASGLDEPINANNNTNQHFHLSRHELTTMQNWCQAAVASAFVSPISCRTALQTSTHRRFGIGKYTESSVSSRLRATCSQIPYLNGYSFIFSKTAALTLNFSEPGKAASQTG